MPIDSNQIPGKLQRDAVACYKQSVDSTALPVFDLAPYLAATQHMPASAAADGSCAALAAGIADSLHRTGCCVIRDPRVTHENETFLDMMEQYFIQSTMAKLPDARPRLHYQVGVTPSGVEVPKAANDAAIQRQIASLAPQHRATPLAKDGADPKWRFMWRVGPRPDTTEYAELNAAPVIPAGFDQWQSVMDGWGEKMLAAVQAVAELSAVGFGLEPSAFAKRMEFGPHLLAPTGADLEEHGQLGKVLAGFHSDLNFLTIHGKSRFPGLRVWYRNGACTPVRIPEGCLIVQAGKQMEWLTGGHVRAGMHEVVCTEATLAAVDAARKAGRPLWRVSSTVFGHIASDQMLTPLGPFKTPTAASRYPAQTAGAFVQRELEDIRLKA